MWYFSQSRGPKLELACPPINTINGQHWESIRSGWKAEAISKKIGCHLLTTVSSYSRKAVSRAMTLIELVQSVHYAIEMAAFPSLLSFCRPIVQAPWRHQSFAIKKTS